MSSFSIPQSTVSIGGKAYTVATITPKCLTLTSPSGRVKQFRSRRTLDQFVTEFQAWQRRRELAQAVSL